jgi:hypothetical protein
MRENIEYQNINGKFVATFDLLHDALGEDPFKK